MKSVLDEIFRMEQEHKKHKGRHQETFHQLVVKRDELKDLIAQDKKRTFNRILKDRYQWGNKMSKHLARILKKKKSINYIDKIQNKHGEIVYKTKEIAEVFKSYYGALYSVNHTGQQDKDKIRKIEEFLARAVLPQIAESDRELLDKPITEEEINKALQDSAPGKSPGPDGFTMSYLKNLREF